MLYYISHHRLYIKVILINVNHRNFSLHIIYPDKNTFFHHLKEIFIPNKSY